MPRDEQLFLPSLVWAYFEAYVCVLSTNLAIFRLARLGEPNIDQVLSLDNIKRLLKAALPHQSRFIDENGPSSYHFLLEEIENLLLTELRNVLEGKEADRFAIERAKEISDALASIRERKAKASAAEISRDG
jgi:hypothetical protein